MSTTDTRAAFEAWAAKEFNATNFERGNSGGYINSKMHIRWESWQAATEAANATMPKVEIELPSGDPRKIKIHLDMMKDGVRWLCCTVDDAKATGTAGEPMSKAEIDAIVYKCRQNGNDTTYDIVNACLAARQPAPVVVKTWQERMADGRRVQNSEWCKDEEIAELRAALEARSQP